MANENENHKKKLKILYEEQGSLLERIGVFQKNLNILLTKKAKFGLDVPLHVLHEIEDNEKELSNAKLQLAENQLEIDSLILQTNLPTSDSQEVLSHLELNGIMHKIETPFPFLRTETTQIEDNKLYTKAYYGGGYEMHSIMGGTSGTSTSFYMHGRQVAPILNTENKKLDATTIGGR